MKLWTHGILVALAAWAAPVESASPKFPSVAEAALVRRPIVIAPVGPLPAVQPWCWGRVVAGVTIGAVVVAAANAAPSRHLPGSAGSGPITPKRGATGITARLPCSDLSFDRGAENANAT